jgi:hypothetical protein
MIGAVERVEVHSALQDVSVPFVGKFYQYCVICARYCLLPAIDITPVPPGDFSDMFAGAYLLRILQFFLRVALRVTNCTHFEI